MKQISFVKLSGAGNDFVLIDTKINRDLNLSSEEIQKLCDRRKGIGADGLILISDIPGYSFDMKYFNSDGSTGSLCGNGARCALRYAFNSGRINGVTSNFKANDLDYSGQILEDGNIKFVLNEPKEFKYNFKIKAAGQLIPASYVDTGAPHVVIKINDVLEDPIKLNSQIKCPFLKYVFIGKK